MPTIGIDTDLAGIRPTADPHFLQTLDATVAPAITLNLGVRFHAEIILQACPICLSLRVFDSRTNDEWKTGLPSGMNLKGIHVLAIDGSKIEIPLIVCDDCTPDPDEKIAA